MTGELHPFCLAFRRANTSEMAEIVASMKATGYDKDQPITLYEGMILDGGSRYEAARETGVEPTFASFAGDDDDAMAFVIRRNKARKHMTKGELHLALAALVTARQGAPEGNKNWSGGIKEVLRTPLNKGKTIAVVAKEGGRPVGMIQKARDLLAHAAPNIIAMVNADEIGVSNATDGIRGKTKEQQAQMTATDVCKAANAYKNKNAASRKPQVAKPKPRKFEQPVIVLGPVPGRDPSFRPEQKVHLYPPRETLLIEDSCFVSEAVGKIGAASEVDIEAIDTALERMLAYEGKYKNIDFAANARGRLKRLAGSLEGIERLGGAIRAILRKRAPPNEEAA